jgi:Programmed cell death protein 2, C-terminal putative domain
MYAPIDYDRSLYLFCCNKRVCSITSEGWTVCRNQQSANSSSSQKKANPPIITEVAPILKVAAAPSVWGSLLEGDDDDDADMMLMLAARDATLASKKTETNKKKETKSVPRKGKESAVCQADEHVLPPLLPQALLCWKVEAVSDPCPYGADVLIHAALRGGDDEEDEVRSALSSVTMQHVQEMLAGYIAAAETEVVEGGEDQGRDDPALIDLLKKEVLAGSAANITKEEKGAAAAAKMKQTKSNNDKKRDAGKAKDKDKEEDKAVAGDTEKEEDAVPVSSDCLSRVEGAFQAAVSHAPSQVVRFAYGGYPLWCTYPPPRAAAAVPLCACGAERVFEMQLMPGMLCHYAYMHAS